MSQDAWTVISTFFGEKGLVRQQLDSFDEFIQNTMQELVDSCGEIQVTGGPVGDVDEIPTTISVSFNQVYVSKPTNTEKDGSTSNMFPHVARLRNLTYASPLYVDLECAEQEPSVLTVGRSAEVERDGTWIRCNIVGLDGDYATVTSDLLNASSGTSRSVKEVVARGRVRVLPEDNVGAELSGLSKEFLGYVPIMLRSRFCVLSDKRDRELCDLGECIYDQGGYFIINGSEKVVVAQERMSSNHVYCFRKKQPHKCRAVQAY